jgi:uncharacterized protein
VIEDWGLFSLQVITLAVMLTGMAGLITTIIPGLTIIWVAALVYGLVTGFTLWKGILFVVITAFMIVGNLADNVLMGATAREKGASWLAIGLSLAAGIAGSIIWPPFGGLVLALLMLFVVEFIRLRNFKKALDSTRSMMMGCGLAVMVRMGIALIMIGLWFIWAFLV